MRTITHVAIRFQGQIWSLPKPNRHNDVIRLIGTTLGIKYVDARKRDQGFLDNEGNYLTRKESLAVAMAANQLTARATGHKLGELYSEDVW